MLILDQPTTQLKNPSQSAKNLKGLYDEILQNCYKIKTQIRFGFVVIEKSKVIPNVNSA
jgi:hypothetical protein